MKAYRYKGQPIAAPGAYADVPIEAYHSGALCVGPSVSSTGLKRVLRSPAHFYAHSSWNPEREPEERSEALDLGAAAHCAALEPDKFAAGFAISEYDDFRTKEAKLWREGLRAEGVVVLTKDQAARVERMADALRRHDLAVALFRNGLAELTLAAVDEPTGLWLLSRPDFVPAAPARGLVDYKTAANGEPGKWSRQAFDLGYDLQAALALYVAELATGEKRPTFWMVVQETEAPFAVTVMRWEPEQIAYGRGRMRDALDRLARARDANAWPAYSTEPVSVVTPGYLTKQIEEAA